jgi:hypothetical protein
VLLRRLAFIALLAAWSLSCLGTAEAVDALVLAKDTQIRQTPHNSAKVLKVAQPGETFEIIARKSGKGPFYVFDERGDLWVRIRVSEETPGFARTDLVSVSREEYRSPKGNPLLLVNLRTGVDGSVTRDLWVVQENWRRTRLLGEIEGRPIWPGHGDWFICQVDSQRPVKDQAVDRNIERIERFSADGRTHNILAAGSNPVLHEARGELFFYRDVDDYGDSVPPGLFAIGVDGTNLHPVFPLPERYKFWKEEGDYFLQAPPPVLNLHTNRIAVYAYEFHGVRVRFTVSLEGQFLELRRD